MYKICVDQKLCSKSCGCKAVIFLTCVLLFFWDPNSCFDIDTNRCSVLVGADPDCTDSQTQRQCPETCGLCGNYFFKCLQ